MKNVTCKECGNRAMPILEGLWLCVSQKCIMGNKGGIRHKEDVQEENGIIRALKVIKKMERLWK